MSILELLQKAKKLYLENQGRAGMCWCIKVVANEGKSREELRREEVSKWEEMTIEEHMEHYTSQGIDKKEAMKMVAKDRGIGKRDVYQQLL